MTYQPKVVVGHRVREIRRARGLSQEDFADELRFHRTYIGSVERGERNLTIDSLMDLADRLGVHMLDLLTPPGR